MNEILAIVIGLLLRLAIPILLTVLLVAFLRRLDVSWREEAQRNQGKYELAEGQKSCYEMKGCSVEEMSSCEAVRASMPCWQAKREANGYMAEECLNCQVFRKAPVPVAAHSH